MFCYRPRETQIIDWNRENDIVRKEEPRRDNASPAVSHQMKAITVGGCRKVVQWFSCDIQDLNSGLVAWERSWSYCWRGLDASFRSSTLQNNFFCFENILRKHSHYTKTKSKLPTCFLVCLKKLWNHTQKTVI